MTNTDWLKDAALRTAWTFVQTFLAALLVLDVNGLRLAAAAGVAAALSALKSIVANTRPPIIPEG